MDKTAFPDGFDHLAERVMHHPVTEWRGRDQAPLWFVDVKTPVCAGRIGLVRQFILQRK
jgi:hypothetical protein